MKRLICGAGAIASMLAMAPALLAQWPAHQAPGVPRLANGQPDMNAPTPRTPDGKPDLSGNWVRFQGDAGRGRGATATPPPAPPGTPPVATFFNVGAGFPDGLPFQPWAAELRKTRDSTNSKDNPDALCLPMGHHAVPHARPTAHRSCRTLGWSPSCTKPTTGSATSTPTAGRCRPRANRSPGGMDTRSDAGMATRSLVETNNLKDDGWLDVRGSPLTDQAKISERFRRVSYRQAGDRHHD